MSSDTSVHKETNTLVSLGTSEAWITKEKGCLRKCKSYCLCWLLGRLTISSRPCCPVNLLGPLAPLSHVCGLVRTGPNFGNVLTVWYKLFTLDRKIQVLCVNFTAFPLKDTSSMACDHVTEQWSVQCGSLLVASQQPPLSEGRRLADGISISSYYILTSTLESVGGLTSCLSTCL